MRSLRIPILGETNYYYLEYRKRSAGAFGGASGADRVLISASNDGASVRPDPYRLDATPGSGGGKGALAHGSSLRVGGGEETVLERLRRFEQERNAALAQGKTQIRARDCYRLQPGFASADDTRPGLA